MDLLGLEETIERFSSKNDSEQRFSVIINMYRLRILLFVFKTFFFYLV